jgi:hypothetical protein
MATAAITLGELSDVLKTAATVLMSVPAVQLILLVFGVSFVLLYSIVAIWFHVKEGTT